MKINKTEKEYYKDKFAEIVNGEYPYVNKLILITTNLEALLKKLILYNINDFDKDKFLEVVNNHWQAKKLKRFISTTHHAKEFIESKHIVWTLVNSTYLLFSKDYFLIRDLFKDNDDIINFLTEYREFYFNLRDIRNPASHGENPIVAEGDYNKIIRLFECILDYEIKNHHPHKEKSKLKIVSAFFSVVILGYLIVQYYSFSQVSNGFKEALDNRYISNAADVQLIYQNNDSLFNHVLNSNIESINDVKSGNNNLYILHAEMGKGKTLFASQLINQIPNINYTTNSSFENITIVDGEVYIIDHNNYSDYEYKSNLIGFIETTLANNPSTKIILLTRCLNAKEIDNEINRNIQSISISNYHINLEGNESPDRLFSSMKYILDYSNDSLPEHELKSKIEKIYSNPILYESASNMKAIVPMVYNDMNSINFPENFYNSIMKVDDVSKRKLKSALKQLLLKYSSEIKKDESFEIDKSSIIYYKVGYGLDKIEEYSLIKVSGLYLTTHFNNSEIKLAPPLAVLYLSNEITFIDYLWFKFWN